MSNHFGVFSTTGCTFALGFGEYLLGLHDHLLCGVHQLRHMGMACLQGATEERQVFNVFVHHLVTKFAHEQPFFGGLNPAETLGTRIQAADAVGCRGS